MRSRHATSDTSGLPLLSENAVWQVASEEPLLRNFHTISLPGIISAERWLVIFVEQLKTVSVFRRASARCSEDLRLEASLEATLQARSDNRPVSEISRSQLRRPMLPCHLTWQERGRRAPWQTTLLLPWDNHCI